MLIVVRNRLVLYNTYQVMLDGSMIGPAQLFVSLPNVNERLLYDVLRRPPVVNKTFCKCNERVAILFIQDLYRLFGQDPQDSSEAFVVYEAWHDPNACESPPPYLSSCQFTLREIWPV